MFWKFTQNSSISNQFLELNENTIQIQRPLYTIVIRACTYN